ncbi:MAG: biopolymer transporter ExbD [Deltaproteobacteria bacterium]|nr:biopolymer transporter ExbD [Deltaproteobacteria bacterium]
MFHSKKHVAHDFELNLTPIIDCFVTLICFLLLSTTYVNLVGLDAKVPISVPASSAKADNEPKFKLELVVKANAIELDASGAGPASGRKTISNVAGKPDFVGLHAALVKIKNERPKEFSLYFTSQVEMDYELLVRFMDTTRNLDAKDGVFAFTDERNGHTVKVDTLFPDFVLANLAAQTAK